MSEKFVTMIKEGEEPIEVHPSVVEAHKKAGWSLDDPNALVEEQPAETKGKSTDNTRKRVKVEKEKTKKEKSSTADSSEEEPTEE